MEKVSDFENDWDCVNINESENWFDFVNGDESENWFELLKYSERENEEDGEKLSERVNSEESVKNGVGTIKYRHDSTSRLIFILYVSIFEVVITLENEHAPLNGILEYSIWAFKTLIDPRSFLNSTWLTKLIWEM